MKATPEGLANGKIRPAGPSKPLRRNGLAGAGARAAETVSELACKRCLFPGWRYRLRAGSCKKSCSNLRLEVGDGVLEALGERDLRLPLKEFPRKRDVGPALSRVVGGQWLVHDL